ncbi:hypothetical protein [Streptomyces sp. NPDC001222]|uniref:hypothetical protein n=1 Tax=Streptomyces sp. NPDC001222 TaxID=3364548 RepID=UPI0036C884A9
MLRKAFDPGLSVARELEVPMSVASAAAQLVHAAIGARHTEEDLATPVLEQARSSGITLEPGDVTVDDGLTAQS